MKNDWNELIDEYITHLKTKTDRISTINNHTNYLKKFSRDMNKSFSKVTIKNIEKWLSNHKNPRTAETKKGCLRAFFKYHNKTDISNSIQSNYKVLRELTKGEEAKLEPAEINKLINTPRELEHKALIETFIITGARLSEIQNLKINDVKLNNTTIWFYVNGKTGKREIPVIPNSENPVAINPKNFKALYNLNKDKEENTYIFMSRSRNRKGKKLTKRGIQTIIKNAKEEAKISKKVTPHIFRHTSASYDGEYLNEQLLCQKYGWQIGSIQARRYCHFNSTVLENNLKKQAGITKEDEKGKICQICGEINNINNELCTRCKTPLNYNKAIEELEKRNKQDLKIFELRKKIDKLEEENKQFKGYIDGQMRLMGYIDINQKKIDKLAKKYHKDIEQGNFSRLTSELRKITNELYKSNKYDKGKFIVQSLLDKVLNEEESKIAKKLGLM